MHMLSCVLRQLYIFSMAFCIVGSLGIREDDVVVADLITELITTLYRLTRSRASQRNEK
jgi:hypothetical protein